jgi:hypothetical protein
MSSRPRRPDRAFWTRPRSVVQSSPDAVDDIASRELRPVLVNGRSRNWNEEASRAGGY